MHAKKQKKNGLKIAFFTDTYLPNVDGVVTSIVSFRKELEKSGHEVFVFSSGSAEDRRTNKDPRVFLYRSVRFPPYPQYKVAIFPFPANSLVREKKIDLVHCHAMASMGLTAIRVAKQSNLPLVGTFHTLVPKATHYVVGGELPTRVASGIAWEAIKLFYLPFDLVIAPSETIRKELLAHGLRRVEVVPTGVDLKQYSDKIPRGPIRTVLGIKDGETMALFMGRLSREKELDVVLRAAKIVQHKNSKIRFVVCGDGPAKAEYEALAKELGLKNTLFTGFVSKIQTPFFYSAADVSVSASTFETQGLAILEGMSCGTPAIVARAMALPEAVAEGKNGFIFKPGDHKKLAELVLLYASFSKAKKAKFRMRARKKAESMSIERMTERLEALYGRVLREKRGK